jgi:iron complex outermembrane receptor protein
VGVVYSSGRGALKLLYGEAFRTPNQYERDYYPATAPTIGVESIRTLELVAERSLTDRLRVSAAAFDNHNAGLVTLSGDADNLRFVNSGRIRSRGLELVSDWRGSSGARARASYTFQRTTESASALVLSNSPAHLAKANLDLPLFARRVWLGSSLEHTSTRTTLGGAALPRVTLANVTVQVPALRPNLALTLGVSNLFGVRYAQPGSEEHRQDALEQAGRSVFLEASWRF